MLDQVTLNRYLSPSVQIAPTVTTGTAAGYATGQFAQTAADTAMLVSSPSGGAARLRLRFVTKNLTGAIDATTCVQIVLKASTSTITSATAQASGGTVLNAQGLTSDNVILTVRPQASTGVVDLIIVMAGALTIDVTLIHRQYVSATAQLALATS